MLGNLVCSLTSFQPFWKMYLTIECLTKLLEKRVLMGKKGKREKGGRTVRLSFKDLNHLTTKKNIIY